MNTLLRNAPLPEFMPSGPFKGRRISLLPGGYLRWVLTRDLPPLLRAALRAEEGLRTMARDQQQGR